jgi:F-type H+-transporting ATPase subunit gamma
MAVGKEIKTQIKSIKNTQKITKAMEMVAASKMKKAQMRMVSARPYMDKLSQIINHVTFAKTEYKHEYMDPREEVSRVGYIIISSDRGLCGGLNTNLFRKLLLEINDWKSKKVGIDVCAIGNKAVASFGNLSDITLVSALRDIGDKPELDNVIGNIKVMIDKFNAKELDKLFVCYNFFENTMSQKPIIKQILPIEKDTIEKNTSDKNRDYYWDYLYEPEAKEVLSELLLRFIETVVYQGLIENIACEQSARMVAMKSATDNAGDMVDDLELVYNKARQAAITQEISEIVSGAAAV